MMEIILEKIEFPIFTNLTTPSECSPNLFVAKPNNTAITMICSILDSTNGPKKVFGTMSTIMSLRENAAGIEALTEVWLIFSINGRSEESPGCITVKDKYAKVTAISVVHI